MAPEKWRCASPPPWPATKWTGLTRAGAHSVVTAALPTAQNIFLHATRYRVGEDVARETILITTLASLPVVLLIAVVLG